MNKFKFEGTVILEAENLDEAFLRLARYFLMLALDEEPPEEHLAGTQNLIKFGRQNCDYETGGRKR